MTPRMAGKKQFQITIILILLQLTLTKEPTVFIKGGILYEQTRDTPVIINPPTVLFTRTINFSLFEDQILQTKLFGKSYQKFCDALNNKVQLTIKSEADTKYFVSEKPNRLADAAEFCRSRQARLPEIRDDKTYQEILTLANQNDIPIVPAGIIPDYRSHLFRFVSDSTDAYFTKNFFSSIYYYNTDHSEHVMKPCLTGAKGGYRDNPGCVKQTVGSLGLAYVFSDMKWELTILDKRYNSVSYKTICHQNKLNEEEQIQANLLLKMAAHTCQRDLYNIQKTSDAIIDEAGKFVHLNASRFVNISHITKREDNFEFDNFNNQTIDPKVFCSLYNAKSYNSDCDIFEIFLQKLTEISKLVSNITNVPDTFVASFLATRVISSTNIIRPKMYYNPCADNPEIYKLNLRGKNENFARLVDYQKATARICAAWHNKQYFIAYTEKLTSREMEKLYIPLWNLYDIYHVEFNYIPGTKPLTRPVTDIKSFLETYNHYNPNKFTEIPGLLPFLDFDYQAKFLNKLESARELRAQNQSDINLNVTLENDTENPPLNMSLKLVRHKRFGIIAASSGALVFSEAAANTIAGKPILNNIGRGISYITGLVHQSEMDKYLKVIEKQAVSIKALEFNQEELSKSYESMHNSILVMDDFQKRLEFSTATLFSGIDHKVTLQESVNAIQSTIQKLAIVITNAQFHACSPYLLSAAELGRIALEHRAKNIFLSDQLDDAHVVLYYYDDKFVFTISLPILNEADKYRIYKASPIPIFKGNEVLQVDMETKYLAHSINSNIYRTLTEEEFNYCRLTKNCIISDVQRPITSDSHCSITTLSKGIQTCKLTQSKIDEPFYHISKNNLIYSVKGPLTTTLLCPSSPDRQTFYLDGMGTAKVAPGCKIFFENDMVAYINPEPTETDLGEVHFMQIFKYTPKASEFNFKIVQSNSTLNIYKPNFTEVRTSDFETILHELSNPNQVIPEIIRVITGIMIFLTIFFLLCCCSSRFRLWFKTCTFCKNPKDYWVDIKNYDISTFTKYKPEFPSKWNRVIPPGLRKNKVSNPIFRRRSPTTLALNRALKSPFNLDLNPDITPKTICEKLKEEEKRSEQDVLLDKMNDRKVVNFTSFPSKAEIHSESPPPPPPQAPVYPSISYVPLPTNYFGPYLPAPCYEDLQANLGTEDADKYTIVLDQPMSQTQRSQLHIK